MKKFSPPKLLVLNYFEDTWIGRPQRRKRRLPRFQLGLWNCFEATSQGNTRTNNAAEGWHRGFEVMLSASHINIYKFIDALQKEQVLLEAEWERKLAGERAFKRRKYLPISQKVRNFSG